MLIEVEGVAIAVPVIAAVQVEGPYDLPEHKALGDVVLYSASECGPWMRFNCLPIEEARIIRDDIVAKMEQYWEER